MILKFLKNQSTKRKSIINIRLIINNFLQFYVDKNVKLGVAIY